MTIRGGAPKRFERIGALERWMPLPPIPGDDKRYAACSQCGDVLRVIGVVRHECG